MHTPILYPQTNPKKTEELLIERASGVYVYDESGKQYIEGMAGLWSASLGYGHEELIEAASEQLRDLSYAPLFGGKSHAKAIELSHVISDMVPMSQAKVFFGNSGSDANDTLMKIIRYFNVVRGKPNKRKIISRNRGYHGVTMASSCLTGLPAIHQHFDLPIDQLGIFHTDCPHYYRYGEAGESEAQYCDRIIGNVVSLIEKEGAETIAAFIAEPINGAGGVVVPPAGYFEKLQAVLTKYDIMLIADEVITGFGRTGEAFGCDLYHIQPDMMTLAKAMSASYMPISASVVSHDIYQALIEPSNDVGVFGHGYTYSGHPVCAAVALKTIEIYKRDNLFNHAKELGGYFQRELSKLMCYESVGEVRGHGMIAALEIVSDRQTKLADAAMANQIVNACLENGLIVRQIYGNSIALCPPLIVDKKQVDEILGKLSLSIQQCSQ